MLVLDSSAITALSERTRAVASFLSELRSVGLWPAAVPSPVLVEALRGDPARDAAANRLLQVCDVITEIPEGLARRAARLRSLARRGSAVDALLVALAEPGGTVLTADLADLRALASHARRVGVERV